jgi:hypothetical protein
MALLQAYPISTMQALIYNLVTWPARLCAALSLAHVARVQMDLDFSHKVVIVAL